MNLAKNLCKYFMRRFSVKDMSDDVIDLFLKYQWPGNVRELQGVLEYAVNLETRDTISIEFIEKWLKLNHNRNDLIISNSAVSLDTAVKKFEKKYYKAV